VTGLVVETGLYVRLAIKPGVMRCKMHVLPADKCLPKCFPREQPTSALTMQVESPGKFSMLAENVNFAWNVSTGKMFASFREDPLIKVTFLTKPTVGCIAFPLSSALVAGKFVSKMLGEHGDKKPFKFPLKAPLKVKVPSQSRSNSLATMDGQLMHALETLRLFADPCHSKVTLDKGIPACILRKAVGLCFITEVKGTFIAGASFGLGIVLSRLPNDEWSAPLLVGTGGGTFGAQIGIARTDLLLVITCPKAMKAFTTAGQLRLGVDVGIAAGVLGRELSMDMVVGKKGAAPAFSYSVQHGAYAGAGLAGEIVLARERATGDYYQRRGLKANHVLSGDVPRPDTYDAHALYDLIATACETAPVKKAARKDGAKAGTASTRPRSRVDELAKRTTKAAGL
tara:strand:- start:753 stop:1946 length:1194 start_codon:yes stop_codon:yes gene_type:complete